LLFKEVESIGAVKTEGAATAGVRLQEIREACFYTCALVLEEQRSARRREIVQYAFAVRGGLELDTSESVALFLGFDNPHGAPSTKRR
jgi:hypothetical protein